MSHDAMKRLLDDYLDKELTAARRRELETHLASCEPCRAELSRRRALLDEAASLPREMAPPEGLWAKIEASIAEDAGSVASLPWHRRAWPRTLAAAALLLVIILGAGPVMERLGGTDPMPRRSAGDGIVNDGVHATLMALSAECRHGDRELRRFALSGDRAAGPTLALMSEHMRLVDIAIEQAEEAWRANPDDEHLARRLLAAYRSKASLQKRAVRIVDRI